MDWTDYFSSALSSPAGQFVIGVFVLMFGSTAILSEKTAKEKFGAIGLVARWIQRRRETQAELEEELLKRRTQSLWDEIERVDMARRQDKENFTERISHLERVEQQQHNYIVWITDKWHRVEVWAAEKGLTLPPPPFESYNEWIARRGDSE